MELLQSVIPTFQGTFQGLLSNFLWASLAGLTVHWWHRRKNRRMRTMLERFEQERGQREIALIIASRGEDIAAAVQAFLGKDIAILKVIKDSAFTDNEEEWLAFAREIRRCSSEIRRSGVTRVHLFMNTPVAIGVFAGAILDGGPEVYVYHYFSGTYRRVGTLAHEAVVN